MSCSEIPVKFLGAEVGIFEDPKSLKQIVAEGQPSRSFLEHATATTSHSLFVISSCYCAFIPFIHFNSILRFLYICSKSTLVRHQPTTTTYLPTPLSEMASKFEKALSKIDEAHSQDPNLVTIPSNPSDSNDAQQQIQIPYELHYSNKMTAYLLQHDPSASESLRLAVRAQHLRRWEVPRSSYPMNRQGYLSWRTALKNRQAGLAKEICLECGYSDEDAGRVAALVRKENMKRDAECQVLEDVACLVFLDDQFEQFEKSHDEEKVVGILKKTWVKMSERGHELALLINMSDRAKELVTKAVSS